MEKNPKVNNEDDEMLSKADRKCIEDLTESKYFVHLTKECINRIISQSLKRNWRYATALISGLLVILGLFKLDYELKFNNAEKDFNLLYQNYNSLDNKLGLLAKKTDKIEAATEEIFYRKEQINELVDQTKKSTDDYIDLFTERITLLRNQSNFFESQISNLSAMKDSVEIWTRIIEDSLISLGELTTRLENKTAAVFRDYDNLMTAFDSTLDRQVNEWDRKTQKIRNFASQNLVVNRGERSSTSKRYYPATLVLSEDTLDVVYYDYVDDVGLFNSRIATVLTLRKKTVVQGTAFMDVYVNNNLCSVDTLVEGDDYQEIEGTDYQIRALTIDKYTATLEISLR